VLHGLVEGSAQGFVFHAINFHFYTDSQAL